MKTVVNIFKIFIESVIEGRKRKAEMMLKRGFRFLE